MTQVTRPTPPEESSCPSARAAWCEVRMDTVVSIALSVPATAAPCWSDAVGRAFNWFATVERACSRFDPDSEVSRLATAAGRPVRGSCENPTGRLEYADAQAVWRVDHVSPRW